MNHKIALLADIHGNTSALKVVIEDCRKEDVTDYWFLGDLIMPGPGTNDLFELLDSVKVGTYVKGNWEDCFLDVLNKEVDLDNASDLYLTRLVQYQCENLDERYIELIKNELPMVDVVACPATLAGMPPAKRLERWTTEYIKYIAV